MARFSIAGRAARFVYFDSRANSRRASLNKKLAFLNGSKLTSCQRTRPSPSIKNVPCKGALLEAVVNLIGLEDVQLGVGQQGKIKFVSIGFAKSDECLPQFIAILGADADQRNPRLSKSLAKGANALSCSTQCKQPKPK